MVSKIPHGILPACGLPTSMNGPQTLQGSLGSATQADRSKVKRRAMIDVEEEGFIVIVVVVEDVCIECVV